MGDSPPLAAWHDEVSDLETPQSCVGRFVAMSIDAVRTLEDFQEILRRVRSELLHPEDFDHEPFTVREAGQSRLLPCKLRSIQRSLPLRTAVAVPL